MISNGGTRKTIHAIINTYRNFEAEWSTNCCGETMYRTMEKAGYKDWTVTKHGLWHNERGISWDPQRLDVGDLRMPSVSVAVGYVSFRSLAKNMRRMPEGDDALDLTRMVRYCVQNSEEGWRYPNDYEELLDLLGGPAKAREPNADGAVFRRWENRKAPPPTPRPMPPPAGVELVKSLTQAIRRTSGPSTKLIAEERSRTVPPAQGSLLQRTTGREAQKTSTEVTVDEDALASFAPCEIIGIPYQRGTVSLPGIAT